MMLDTAPLLQLKNISKSFGPIKPLIDASFDLRAGEIHALAGSNGAGKSTLMNIISGVHKHSSGNIYLRGKPIELKSPQDAIQRGIAHVHQEIVLCPDVSVAENVLMTQISSDYSFFVNYSKLKKKALQTLRLITDISPETITGELSISRQQLVEICRALTMDCSILILDEPTSTLTQKETLALFKILRQLRDRGMAIIYVSHRMSEIVDLCDRITFLRDGRTVSTDNVIDLNSNEIVYKLIGRKIEAIYPRKSQSYSEDLLLKIEGLCSEEKVQNVSFELKRGEIFGLTGLVGSGRSELLQAICGLGPRTGGAVHLSKGQAFEPKNYAEAIAAGMVCLPESRKANGVFLELSILSNISSMNLSQISSAYHFIDKRKERDQASALGERLRLKSASLKQNVAVLSGGNQQKVAIAKVLSVNPSILLLDEPTRGVDISAKSEIHHLLRDLADNGVGVLVVSSDLDEVIGLCDRVMVMFEGQKTGILSGQDVTEGNIVKLASGATIRDVH